MTVPATNVEIKGTKLGIAQKEKGCFRCGRTTHLKRVCVAKRQVDGTILPTGGKDNKEYKKEIRRISMTRRRGSWELGKHRMKLQMMTTKNRIF